MIASSSYGANFSPCLAIGASCCQIILSIEREFRKDNKGLVLEAGSHRRRCMWHIDVEPGISIPTKGLEFTDAEETYRSVREGILEAFPRSIDRGPTRTL